MDNQIYSAILALPASRLRPVRIERFAGGAIGGGSAQCRASPRDAADLVEATTEGQTYRCGSTSSPEMH